VLLGDCSVRWAWCPQLSAGLPYTSQDFKDPPRWGRLAGRAAPPSSATLTRPRDSLEDLLELQVPTGLGGFTQ